MRQFTLIAVSIVGLATLLGACGTKGPLTLPKPAAIQPDSTPAVNPNTGTGQR